MIGRSEQARRRRQVRRQIIQLVAVRRGDYSRLEPTGAGVEPTARAKTDQCGPTPPD